MSRSEMLDKLKGHTVKLYGRYFRARLVAWNAHDLWLWPAYARPPHDVIDSGNAARGGRHTVRLDDRNPENRILISKIIIVK